MSDDNFDHQTLTLAIDDKLGEELQKLEAAGWQIMPGSVPVAVYQLRRARGMAGQGGIMIDESKVYVIKAKPAGG